MDAEHFYGQGGDGFTPRCKDCIRAATRERKAAARERRQAAPPPKRCAGPCGRELPADAEHFPFDVLGRVKARCHECVLAVECARVVDRAAVRAERADLARQRERAAADCVAATPPPAPPTKICAGPCGRELPADAEHFHRHQSGRHGLNARCRGCRNAYEYERRTGRSRPTPAAVTEPPSPAASPDVDARELADAERAAEDAELDDLIAELAGLCGEDATPIGPFSSREGRLRFIRRRIEMAPAGQAAEAADRARRVMAAADREVRELTRPPFDAHEVFLDIADAASDEGVKVLATALRGLGWAP